VGALPRRSITGFAETLACLGRTGVGGATEIRTPGVIGARVPWATDNHWVDAAVADAGAALVDPPHCVWSVVVPEGRSEIVEIAMPCMGLVLDDWQSPSAASVETPSLAVVGALNDRAYGQRERLGPLIGAIVDTRVRTHGLRVDDEWACVVLTLRHGDDVSVQYVATDARFRRRGLAAQVVGAALTEARDDGVRTATLQASPDGFGVYERLGFRTVATLRASRA
jgi:ribosomal protein S18 acetylase RimI-like enzyme